MGPSETTKRIAFWVTRPDPGDPTQVSHEENSHRYGNTMRISWEDHIMVIYMILTNRNAQLLIGYSMGISPSKYGIS
jgi:hypothetical protein